MRQYQFSKSIQNYDVLIEIYKILDDKIEIINGYLIYPDNYEDYIGDRNKKLSKNFYAYKCKEFYKAYSRTEWEKFQKAEQERKRQEELKRKRKEEKIQRDQNKIDELKKNYGEKWRSKEWIEKNIGEYYNWMPCFEYYWTIIGDDYSITWNGVRISKESREEIKKIKNFELSGSSFLGRKFKRNGYSKEIDSKNFYFKQKKVEHYGVYGIYKDDELLYVGSTMRNFEDRMKEHRDNINNGSTELYFYKLVNKNDELKYRILIDVSEIKTNKKIDRTDVESMELALISYLQPVGNLAGRVSEFRYK